MRLICHTLSLCGLACLSSALRRHPGVAQPARDGALEAWAHHRNDTQHRRLSSMSRKPTAEASSPAEHRVASLPGLAAKDAPTSWAGYITVSPSERSRLFYWLFEHRPAAPTQNNAGADTPLVVWLNGGPGCSSMDGLFIENGPLKVLPGSQGLKTHPHGWDRVGHLLYLEQPVGTGLSYTGRGAYRANDKEVNEHLCVTAVLLPPLLSYRPCSCYSRPATTATLLLPLLYYHRYSPTARARATPAPLLPPRYDATTTPTIT